MSLSDAAKARTEAAFKRKEEQARDGANAWAEYEAKSRAIAKNMERLRALRLAKEAAARPHPQSSNGAEPVTQSPASATTTPPTARAPRRNGASAAEPSTNAFKQAPPNTSTSAPYAQRNRGRRKRGAVS